MALEVKRQDLRLSSAGKTSKTTYVDGLANSWMQTAALSMDKRRNCLHPPPLLNWSVGWSVGCSVAFLTVGWWFVCRLVGWWVCWRLVG